MTIRSACTRVAALIILAGIAAPHGLFAQSAADVQREINEHNTQIDALNKEIAEYEKQLTAVSAKKKTLQNTVDQINLSIKKTTASINVTKNQISSTQLQIKQLSEGIQEKSASIESTQAGIGESIRRLNDLETQPLVVQIFSNDTISNMWEDIDQSQSLQATLSDQATELTTQKESLTETKTTAEAKNAQLVKQQQTLNSQQGTLNAQKSAQNELLAQTKSQESTYQAILAQKQAEKVAFESALFELASKLDYALDPSKIPTAGKGVLRWPLDNVFVTQQFGKTSSSGRLYSSGTHDGIDLRASIGTPVRAALSGTVAEVNYGAAKNCQYGMWVLVKHGNGLTTLYAHLSNISVQKGQAVSTGQVLGYSGDTGYATGPHLHFTVYASESVSQKSYTCKNGVKVNVPIAPLTGYLNPMNYL